MTHYQTRIQDEEPRNYIFEMCVSVNGRYMIVRDSVFDMQEQKTIGNLWDSIDIFKTIFKNTNIDTADYKQIQEGFEALPITENDGNLHGLRDILLEFNFFQDTWLGKELKSTGEGIKNFVTDSWEGLKKFGVAISKGDWKEILTLLAKGVKFLLRKLKDALYSTVGMIVDAILIATGVGKSVQWIPWALVLALDIYQMISGDWPDDEKDKPLWAKWLDIGFDVLGVVIAGAAAKAGRLAVAPMLKMTGSGRIAAWLAKNPRVLKMIDSIIVNASKAPGFLSRAAQSLAKKFPAGAKFIESILGRASKMMQSLVDSLKSLKGGAGASKGLVKTGAATKGLGTAAKAGVKAGAVIYGVHKGVDYLFPGDEESANGSQQFAYNSGDADFDAPDGPNDI